MRNDFATFLCSCRPMRTGRNPHPGASRHRMTIFVIAEERAGSSMSVERTSTCPCALNFGRIRCHVMPLRFGGTEQNPGTLLQCDGGSLLSQRVASVASLPAFGHLTLRHGCADEVGHALAEAFAVGGV